jgi:hypothetical protein
MEYVLILKEDREIVNDYIERLKQLLATEVVKLYTIRDDEEKKNLTTFF